MSKNISVSFIVDGELFHTMVVTRETPCEELISVLRAQMDPKEFFTITLGAKDGLKVGGGKVEELLAPGQPPAIVLFVKKIRKFQIFVIGVPNLEVKTRASSLSTPEALIADIKKEFGIDETRIARLKSQDKILEPLTPLGEQTDEAMPIGFDLELKFTIDEMAAVTFERVLYINDKISKLLLNGHLSKETRKHVMVPDDPHAIPAFYKKPSIWSATAYASETCLKLLPGEPSIEELRFTITKNGREIRADQTVSELLSEEEILNNLCPRMRVERKMTIEVNNLITKKSTLMSIWPSMKLKQLLSKQSQCLCVGAEIIESDQMAYEAGLQDHSSLTITKFHNIRVIDSSGGVHKMKVDFCQDLMDLHQLLAQYEDNDNFKIWLNDQKLVCDNRQLIDVGFKKDSIVTLTYKKRHVKLLIEGQSPAALMVRQGTPFKAFMQMASRALRRQLPHDTRFVCECGRVLSCESAARKVFPIRCCPVLTPTFKLEIPEDQVMRGHKTESKFRAPRTQRLSKQLERITTLSSCESEYKRQKTEAELIKDCLLSEKATNMQVTFNDRLDLGLEVDKKRTMFSVWPSDTMFSVLMEIQKKQDRRVIDFALHRHQRLFVGLSKDRTFADAALSEGQTLMVIFEELEDRSTQTDIKQNTTAIQVGPGKNNRIPSYKEASTAHPPQSIPSEASTAHPPQNYRRPEQPLQRPPPLDVANFSISWWWFGAPEVFEMPFWEPGLWVKELRAEAAARQKVLPSGVRLLQKRGRRVRDGAPLVETIGNSFGTAIGARVRSSDVKEIEEVELHDGEILPLPGTLRAVISARRK